MPPTSWHAGENVSPKGGWEGSEGGGLNWKDELGLNHVFPGHAKLNHLCLVSRNNLLQLIFYIFH